MEDVNWKMMMVWVMKVELCKGHDQCVLGVGSSELSDFLQRNSQQQIQQMPYCHNKVIRDGWYVIDMTERQWMRVSRY